MCECIFPHYVRAYGRVCTGDVSGCWYWIYVGVDVWNVVIVYNGMWIRLQRFEYVMMISVEMRWLSSVNWLQVVA
jgi:hypothetical protein